MMMGMVRDPERGLVFVHIPKAAGTTLRSIMLRQFPAERTINLPKGERAVIAGADRQRVRLILGHVPVGDEGLLAPPVDLVTMLRSPVDRVVSIYYYWRRRGYPSAQGKTLEEFANSGHVQVENDQTRRLAGEVDGAVDETMLETAKRALRDRFACFGLHERFDESVLLMQKTFGWGSVHYRVMNATPGRVPVSSIAPAILSQIGKRNELDCELYAFARALFEERLAAEGPAFREEVRRFRQRNTLYSRLSATLHWTAPAFPRWFRRWMREAVNRTHAR